jgi:hypothetical protein
MAVKTSKDFIEHGWSWTSSDMGGWTNDQITAAATVQIGLDIQALHRTMSSIYSLMLQLGRDGIHEVLQEQRRITRINVQRRKARAKKARAKMRRVAA